MSREQKQRMIEEYISSHGVTHCPPAQAYVPAAMNDGVVPIHTNKRKPALHEMDGDWGDRDYE